MNINKLVEISRTRSIAFDLDNTIYPEEDFLFRRYGDTCKNFGLPDECVDYMKSYFREFGRVGVFEALIDSYSLECRPCELLEFFRNGPIPKYTLLSYSWFSDFFTRLGMDFELNIVTDGYKLQQERKIRFLGLAEKFSNHNFIFSSEFGGKPEKACFDELCRVASAEPEIFVGDSTVDLEFARVCGMEFIDVRELIGRRDK